LPAALLAVVFVVGCGSGEDTAETEPVGIEKQQIRN
jgi:hypothetical protein